MKSKFQHVDIIDEHHINELVSNSSPKQSDNNTSVGVKDEVSNGKSDASDGFDAYDKSELSEESQSPSDNNHPSFPIDVLPVIYRNAVIEIADSIGAPVDIPSITLISLVGAAIGRTRCLKIKKGWMEYPNLYVGIIGPSGIGKSPSSRLIYKCVEQIEKEWFDAFKGQAQSQDSDPKLKQLIVDDATIEAITRALEANPRGILWSCDELAGLFKNLDKYSGKDGATLTRLMSAYDSGPWKVNRADQTKISYIHRATLSLYGTIQERALLKYFLERIYR